MAASTGGNRLNFDLKPFDTSAMANGFLSAYQNNMNQVSDFMKNAANMNIQAQTIPYAMAKLEDEYKRNQYNFRVGEEKWKLFEQQLEADQWVRENWDKLYDNNTGRFRKDAIDQLRAALPNNTAAIPLLMNYAKGMSTEQMMKDGRGYFVAEPWTDPNAVAATVTPPAAAEGQNGGNGKKGVEVKGATPETGKINFDNFNTSIENPVSVTTTLGPVPSTSSNSVNPLPTLSATDPTQQYQAELNAAQQALKDAKINADIASMSPGSDYMYKAYEQLEDAQRMSDVYNGTLGYNIPSFMPNGNAPKNTLDTSSYSTLSNFFK